jgi:iron complex transport system ATP-binding protein
VLDEPTAFLDVPSRVELMGLLRQLTRRGRLAVIVSTHDLELALRLADLVWLVMPGGELVAGAPEDLVLSGAIAQAFEGRQVRFHPEERTFRLLTGESGAAHVHGAGLRAAMAKAVLEREGYAIADVASACCLSIDVRGDGWQAVAGAAAPSGRDFASLAAWLRRSRAPAAATQIDLRTAGLPTRSPKREGGRS